MSDEDYTQRLKLVRGDNPLIELTFLDATGAPLDITNLVLRGAMKRRINDVNPLIQETSYRGGRILKTFPLTGVAVWLLHIEETHNLPIGDLYVDVEATGEGESQGAGTIDVANGLETLVFGGGLTADDVQVGDFLTVTSADPENAGSFCLDLNAEGVPYVNDYSSWTTALAETVTLYRGHRETPIRFILDVSPDIRR